MKTTNFGATAYLEHEEELKHDRPVPSRNKAVAIAISDQTVPLFRSKRLVSFPELEVNDLREVARSRSSLVSATPRHSEAGLHGFTPHQQFIIAVSMLITSTFTVAYAISPFLL